MAIYLLHPVKRFSNPSMQGSPRNLAALYHADLRMYISVLLRGLMQRSRPGWPLEQAQNPERQSGTCYITQSRGSMRVAALVNIDSPWAGRAVVDREPTFWRRGGDWLTLPDPKERATPAKINGIGLGAQLQTMLASTAPTSSHICLTTATRDAP